MLEYPRRILALDVTELHRRCLEEPEILEELAYQVRDLADIFDEWVLKARKIGVNIDSIHHDCEKSIESGPSLEDERQFIVVNLMHQLSIYHIYLRRVVKTYIHYISESAKQMPELQHLTNLINGSERFLIKQLPTNPFKAKLQYTYIDYKLGEITEKIMSKARLSA